MKTPPDDSYILDSQMVAESVCALLKKFDVNMSAKMTAMLNIVGQIYGINKDRKGLQEFIHALEEVYEFWERE